MAQPKDTASTAEKQPPNNLYGRIPTDLLPKLRELSNLECKIFMFLTTLANFKRSPLGEVCLSRSEIARRIGIDRTSLRRGITTLESSGLIVSGPSKCVMVTHYMGHGDPPTGHSDSPPGSPRPANSPQPQQDISTYEAPIRSEEVSEEAEDAAAEKEPRKAPRKRVKPFLYWDDRERIKAREEDPRFAVWHNKWVELLGSEDRVDEETEKAILWLRNHPKVVARMKSYSQFMDRWLEKEIPE